ncbi:MAG: low temperature requirement protein A [Micromonosporaceae bacterium]
MTEAETTGEPAQAEEQKVSWSELFIDLVWVFGITQIAAALAHGHGLGDVALSLLLLLPLWWGWVGTTVYANAAGARIETAYGRLVLFAVAGCVFTMAVALPTAYGGGGLLFAGAYTVLRIVLWSAIRPLRFYGAPGLDPFGIGLFFAAPLFLAGGFLDGPWRVALWTVAAFTEIAGPRLLGKRLAGLHFETAHLPERFGLFMIIVLGETIVATGSAAAAGAGAGRAPGPAVLGALALGFVLIVALWWTYFHFAASAVRHALRTANVQARIVRDVFTYAHLAYVIALIGVAVGLKKLLAHPLEHPHSVLELLLAPGAALYLLGFSYARWRMFGAPTVFRAAAAGLCLVLAAAAPLLPLVVTAALVAAILVALNALEFFWVTTGRPLLLIPAPGARP